jgi:Tubulin folding cofactor D C terminal
MDQHRPAATALTDYVLEREAASPEEHITDAVFRELLEMAKSNSTSNTVVLPILATLDILIEGGVVAEISDSQERRDM